MKNIFTISLALISLVMTACDNSSSSYRAPAPGPVEQEYVQIERLARPAINEGLVLSNDNLNAFNSIGPSLDLRSDIPAVAAVLNEAVAVLTVVTNLGTNAGLTPTAVGDIAGQFLPDVVRISVDDSHYGTLHTLSANADRTSDSKQGEVAYTSCVSLTAGAPLLCGGRKIRDDVVDITLSYLAGGASFAAPGSINAVPSYLVSDQISYSTSHSEALLSSFPFLANPL